MRKTHCPSLKSRVSKRYDCSANSVINVSLPREYFLSGIAYAITLAKTIIIIFENCLFNLYEYYKSTSYVCPHTLTRQ